MTPAQVQAQVDVLLSAGELLIKTVGAPVTQGAGTTGTQGTGVRTPIAAEVAAATAGLANEVHSPKGRIFDNGT